MTSTTAPVAMTDRRLRSERVRGLLLVDAATCVVTGVVALVAAGPVADRIGVDSEAWVRGTGVFLVVYSFALGLLARARPAVAASGAAATAIGDGLWIAATIALVVAGIFSGGGIGLMSAVALVVAALGLAKARAVRR
jgi:hypothetical protein